MVEVVVMMAIITVISSIVLFSFTGLNEGAALNRSARELALALRRAQNISLAVSQVEVGDPASASLIIPPAVGVRLVKSASSYLIFGDLKPAPDNRYNGTPEKIGSDILMERGVAIESLLDQNGASHNIVHVLFTAPEAVLTLSDENGLLLRSNSIKITLSPPSGQPKKVITVRTNGQISVK